MQSRIRRTANPYAKQWKAMSFITNRDEAYLFTDIEFLNPLAKDALDFVEGWNNGNKNFCEPMTEEEYEWIRKIVIHPKDGTISVLK